MEDKKQLGGKRKGAGRKPLLSKKKQQVSLYVEGAKIITFGSEEEMKNYLYDVIDKFNKSGLIYSTPTASAYDGERVGTIKYDESAQWVESVKKIPIKRTPAQWVELRRACENADAYDKWLEDLGNDTFLTNREKAQIKQTV